MEMDRRSLIGFSAVALATLPSCASLQEQLSPAPPADPTEILPLWPDGLPDGAHLETALSVVENSHDPDKSHDRVATGIAKPTLSVFRPAAPDGSAVLILPGGGYRQLDIDGEGFDVARRLNETGITAFVLFYRLPHEGWRNAPDVPLQDAQRAIRVIRADAPRFAIDAGRTGVLGFSAGGHLAASLATRSGVRVYTPRDATDAETAAPSFAALLYPVITMLLPFAHEATRDALLGSHPSSAQRAAYSCERLVKSDTPPCFLAAAADDPDVAPENTLSMFASLRAARVPAEMHMFEKGGHGFGIRSATEKPASVWPELLLRWGQARGYFLRAAATS
jgi:acetyl esterase/lipase